METLDNLFSTIFVARQNIHGRHFNVTGPHFGTLHDFFKEAYEMLNTWYDKVGELIRRQKEYTPYGITAMYDLSAVKSDDQIYDDFAMAEMSAHDLLTIETCVDRAIDSGMYDNATENDLAQLASDLAQMWYKIGSFTGATIPE